MIGTYDLELINEVSNRGFKLVESIRDSLMEDKLVGASNAKRQNNIHVQ